MTATLRTRLLSAAGAALVAAGLAATAVAATPAFADTATTTATATVDNVLELTSNDASFTLQGAPGSAVTATSGLIAKTNNAAGYNITVLADAATLAGQTTGNTDTIDVSALTVEGTAASATTATTVHTQSTKSAEAGDAITADYGMTIPWVNADTYTVGLTFTATAN